MNAADVIHLWCSENGYRSRISPDRSIRTNYFYCVRIFAEDGPDARSLDVIYFRKNQEVVLSRSTSMGYDNRFKLFDPNFFEKLREALNKFSIFPLRMK